MYFLMLALRLIHVLCGILWVGLALFVPLFLAPVLAGLGPDGGKVMAGLQRRGLMTVLPILALATILSGAALFWRVSGGQLGDFLARPTGATLATGAVAAMLALALGMRITRPAAAQIAAAVQRLATASAEERADIQATLARLQQRVTSVGRLITGLLLLAAGAMAMARYL